MRKLTLDVNALAVESFGTARDEGARGTVRGHDSLDPGGTGGGDSCGLTCPATCRPSCGDTCFWTCAPTGAPCVEP
jgi:hypothetical protein